jgi:hypothetical protein
VEKLLSGAASRFFLNREPWGKAPRQNETILKENGNKYLQQAQPEVRRTEGGERRKRPKGQKAKKSQQNKAKTITRLAARARWKDEDLI